MRQHFALSFEAAAAILGMRLVALNDDGQAITAASSAARIIGASDAVGAAAGEMLDAHMLGELPVTAGGVIKPGDPVTADAQGRAVVASPVAGTVMRIAGFATTKATAAGDIVQVFLLPSVGSSAAA
ncbi:conserved hypothetical protein [uncultured Pleomorphomonas sp.]|uniref:DUF2190 domain-containing protein n=1 Tax=uncultured Pleomorphomonas sp. TaxID=442121 RepID=A0A212LCX8_9HYPH|nr:capsid cement protein [uncultured Pleomorphomonas sp.]SCM75434.1 conserved hypothetical protein [uncultured Pleomorphomonas sp.]